MKADRADGAKSRAIEDDAKRCRRLMRNGRQRELYGPKHRRRRHHFVERGDAMCPRCEQSISPDDLWDLGHDDRNPSLERPEHRGCNRTAANQLRTSREW